MMPLSIVASAVPFQSASNGTRGQVPEGLRQK
jgi:hypothetical protein